MTGARLCAMGAGGPSMLDRWVISALPSRLADAARVPAMLVCFAMDVGPLPTPGVARFGGDYGKDRRARQHVLRCSRGSGEAHDGEECKREPDKGLLLPVHRALRHYCNSTRRTLHASRP